MKIIADSGSTRTDWVLVDGDNIVEHAFTKGLNPYFYTRREISHIIRLELPEIFFKRRWDGVYFYGAGCSAGDKQKQIEASLVSQFKTPATVESDLIGAARGLLGQEEGIACILGTGSNSCRYDGNAIVKRVRSGGYLLGDEGSGASLGRMFVSDCLKNLAPTEIMNDLYDRHHLTPEALMDTVYSSPVPNSLLNTYSFILAEHIESEYVHDIVVANFRNFFQRHLMQYDGIENEQVCFVGANSCIYDRFLKEVAGEFSINITKIKSCSMPGLIKFHK